MPPACLQSLHPPYEGPSLLDHALTGAPRQFSRNFTGSQGRLKLVLNHGSCLCQTNSPFTFTTMTSQLLNCATVRGDQCSEKDGQALRPDAPRVFAACPLCLRLRPN
jgi:hypothetical protein